MPDTSNSQASFRLADGLGYSLQQDHRSVIRLNLQHFLWRQVFGFSVHPSIPAPTFGTIADVACGTALWLTDVSREFPSCHLDGLEIDLTQAPHPGWLPSNIHLRHWDLLTDVPAGLNPCFQRSASIDYGGVCGEISRRGPDGGRCSVHSFDSGRLSRVRERGGVVDSSGGGRG